MLIYLAYGMSFVLAMMLQYGVFSRWMILSGSPDLVLLLIIALCLHQKHRRFWILIPVLAVAGSLAEKKFVPTTGGTLPTHTPVFVLMLVAVVIIVGALTFVPALSTWLPHVMGFK